MRLRLFWFFAFSFLSLLTYAQNNWITGKVTNERNEPLPGVSVKIIGHNGGTATDVDGRYTLQVSPGVSYELEFSAIGYVTKKVHDIFISQGLEEMNIVLETAAKSIEAVVVRSTSRRQENTAALLSFQRNNISLSSGLAADFIKRTPDKNTGEVLKRVSGASLQDNRFVVIRGLSDRYNSAMINSAHLPSTEPDKRAFSFDVIPSSLIDNIIISKTATPDVTGEFAGGVVQINTKDIPARDFLSLGISIGFNTQSAFKDFVNNRRNPTDWLGYDNGNRAMPRGFPGSAQAYRLLSSSTTGVEKQVELSKLFNNGAYLERKNIALPTRTFSITWGNRNRLKNGGTFGTVISLQYRNSMLKSHVQRLLHQNDGEVLLELVDDQNRFNVTAGALANITYAKGNNKLSFKNIFNQLLEDNYYIRTGISNDRFQEINFRSSVFNQRSLYSGQLEGDHQITATGIRLRWNGNFSYNSKSQPDLRTSAYFRSKGTYLSFEHNDDDTRRFFSNLKDISYGASGSLNFPFIFKGEKQSLKLGGSAQIRVRNFKSRIFRYEPASILQFDASKNFLPYDKIFDPSNIAMDGFKLLEFTNNQDKYFAASARNGIFGMFDNKIGKIFRLAWGLRLENFQQFLTTKDVSAKRVIIETEKWDLLPSFNFTISPSIKHNLRISGSRTIARPEFREIAPFSFFDYEANYSVNGNPGLKRTTISNGDIRFEWYPDGGEAITIGTFYKKFNDPIELRLNPSSVPDRRNYEYANAAEAYSIGVELELRKGLDFINVDLETFNVFANITYIYSEVTLESTSGSGGLFKSSRPLQGQSPYLVNLGLQYNSRNAIWTGSLLYNRAGHRLALVGINDLGFPDIYERPRDQVDLQLSKRILNKKGEIKITWADLLNPAFYFYENVDSKKAFTHGTDRMFQTYNPGSTISFGFTYDFNLGKNKK